MFCHPLIMLLDHCAVEEGEKKVGTWEAQLSAQASVQRQVQGEIQLIIRYEAREADLLKRDLSFWHFRT